MAMQAEQAVSQAKLTAEIERLNDLVEYYELQKQVVVTEEIIREVEVVVPKEVIKEVEVVVPSEGSDSTIKDPTFEELKDFILADLTSSKQFVLGEYECRHFAADVNNNAHAAGLRCAFVMLCYDDHQHAIVAFNTVDRGMVFIEPQTDASVFPEVGEAYKYDGQLIREIIIVW
jgi:hypothetical protein